MKKILTKLALSIIALMALLPSTAALAASYGCALLVIESTGTDYTNLGTTLDIPSSSLVTGNFLTSTGLDSRVYIGTDTYPHILASDRALAIFSLTGNTQTNVTFSTGETALTSFYIIPGYGGYVTVDDAPNLEITANGTVIFSEVYNTGNSGSFFTKGSAFTVSSDGSGTYTAALPQLNSSTNLYPNAAGSLSQLFAVGGTAITATQTNDGDTSYVYNGLTSWYFDLLNVDDPAVDTGADITNVQVVCYVKQTAASTGKAVTTIEANGSSWQGAQIPLSTSYGAIITNYATNPTTGVDWTWSDIETTQAGVGLIAGAVGESRCTQIYLNVTYHFNAVSVVATGVVDGDNYAVVLDSSNISAYVNGGLQDSVSLNGNYIADTANNWVILDNDVISGMDSFSLAVGGTTQVYLNPNTIVLSSTIPDQAADGTANDGTVTWGTNPAGLTVNVGALLPETVSAATATIDTNVSVIPTTDNATAMVSNPSATGATFPFSEMFVELLTTWHREGGPDIDMGYFWRIVAVIIAWIFGTAVMMGTNVFMGFIAYLVGFIVPAVGMQETVLDLWVPIVYAIGGACLALLVSKWSSSSL